MHENYGDVAIGYVQLKRERDIYIVKAEICPEQRVRNKNYHETVTLNESEETIISAICKDCVASLGMFLYLYIYLNILKINYIICLEGGCKHAVALLAWIYRKSEEPSPTSIECY